MLFQDCENKRSKNFLFFSCMFFTLLLNCLFTFPCKVSLYALKAVQYVLGKGKDYWEEENAIEEMPACRRMFNIFHPYDPVAYRLVFMEIKQLVASL